MKIFGWMQNKLGGKASKNGPAAATSNYPMKKEAVQEEFSDWPHGLLTIGTFGNEEPKEIPLPQQVPDEEPVPDPSSSPDLSDFTPEEVGKLQEELKKLLSRKSATKASKETTELPLNKFLNCPSSLEIERRIRSSFGCDSGADADEDISKTISVILGKCKEVSAANKKKDIGKKSVAFLLKKMFVCSSGFAPAPRLRDPLPESRMEKLLRAMIYKARFPQPSARPSSATKYLESRPAQQINSESEEARREKARDRSKWVKTDSEYIVLEI